MEAHSAYIGVGCNGLQMLSYHFYTFNTITVKFWRRLLAQLIDFSLTYIVVVMLVMWFTPRELAFHWMLLWAYLIYGSLMDAYGGTFGKMAMGLRVTMNDGSELTILTAFYRNFTKILFTISGFEILLLPLMKGYSGFHNRVAKTLIVKPNG